MSKNNKYIFSEKDYISGDGMMTSVWGPPMWHVLHTISFNYPIDPTVEHKQYYYDFYNNLQNILPCRYCRENLCKNLQKLPLNKDVFKNRTTLSKWVYDLHEMVNTMLGKKSGLSYNDVRDRYEHFRSRCLEDPKKIVHKPSTKETGCVEPLYGLKSKCILNIVPKTSKKSSFKMDSRCILKRNNIIEEPKKVSKKVSKKNSKKGSKK